MTGILQALLASVSAAVSAVTDEYFEYVTMLLPGNGTNGAQNNTFIDGSSNAFTITRNGNTTQGTFTPYGDNWSNYFDGTGDYLTVPDNTAMEFGSGAFTVECWFYGTTSLSNYEALVAKNAGAGTNNAWVLQTNRSTANTPAFVASSGTTTWNVELISSTAYALNTWNHLAAVRSGNTFSLFLNGTRVATTTSSITLSDNAEPTSIGAFSTGNLPFLGYISNARVVKGTAVYDPTLTTLTVPTAPLTAITNTSLLTCQSNRFIDNSTNAFAITVNGNTSVQRFSPFSPTAAYASGTIGGSGYFDGTGDYLSVANNAAFQFGSGDWTFETWVYGTDFSTTRALYALGYGYTNTDRSLIIYIGTSGDFRIAQSPDGSTNYDESLGLTLSTNCWNHLVVSRSGSTVKGFLNGTGGTGLTARNLFASTKPIYIGAQEPVYPAPYVGYMSSVRVLKGTGYTSVTVPTAPLTNITNTSLLLNFTNAGIVDNAMMNDLETVGNAQISTTQSKFGGSSMYFDGTGDYLTSNTATTDLYAFGSGDFTIECWVYLNSVVGYGIIYDGRPATAQTTQPTLFHSGGTIAYYTNGANRIVGSALSTSTWYHIALARSGTSTKLFVDGTQVGSTYTDSTVYTNTSGRPWIGADSFSIGNNLLNGYIDDLRVTKGYARYTANFTAPTAAFPTS